ncbi:MAG: helix-turn-helix transcriptional regulator [Candidatus Melainabacteria bacterium]|nr:MAG: helix-turn-helix transcriptional regulator [Candidatus Melainabacteria bacterium]
MRQSKQRQSNQPLKALGAAIRNCRLDQLMTQQQLSDGAHLHRTYITDVENGLRNISYLTLQRISFALNFKMSQLILNAEIILLHEEL